MLEIYCDSSYNEDGPSYIGIVALADGIEVHQSTTAVTPTPSGNLECEQAAVALAMKIARALRRSGEPVIIYNDSTEAVKSYLEAELSLFPVEYVPRESLFQRNSPTGCRNGSPGGRPRSTTSAATRSSPSRPISWRT